MLVIVNHHLTTTYLKETNSPIVSLLTSNDQTVQAKSIAANK